MPVNRSAQGLTLPIHPIGHLQFRPAAASQYNQLNMTKRVGVRSIFDTYRNFDQLKRDALLFDSIAVIDSGVSKQWGYWLSDEEDARIRADIDWLLEHQIVIDPAKMERTHDESIIGLQAVDSFYNEGGRGEGLVRYYAAVFNARSDTSACWLLPSLPSGGPKRADVLRVVLNAFPIPADDVSWERIEEFRLDHDSHIKRSRLINWINETGRTDLSELELSDKLETLLNDYSEHMRIHEIKSERGIVEAVVVTFAELAEDLVKFKWGKLAKGLFAITHERIELREAELQAPGRELAYLDAAKRAFVK